MDGVNGGLFRNKTCSILRVSLFNNEKDISNSTTYLGPRNYLQYQTITEIVVIFNYDSRERTSLCDGKKKGFN